MNFLKFINSFKYRIIRLIESNPTLNLLIYNNISIFKAFLPHEKDYYGIKLLISNRVKDAIIDVGGNLGISSMGFRSLGFVNKIIIFEPNKYIYKKYIKKRLLENYNNITTFNLALGDKNQEKFFYYPYYKKECIHYFCSFDKDYIKNSIRISFRKKKIKILKNIIKIRSFDSLNLKCKPKFIKIDVEGFDYEVIKGMLKTIKKNNPIILVEFNKNNFFKINNLLRNYNPWVYLYEQNKFQSFKRNMIDKSVARSTRSNLMSIRNVFFIPKNYKWI